MLLVDMLSSPLIALHLLSVGPTVDNNSAHNTGDEQRDYASAVATLEQALVEVNTNPDTGIVALSAALDALGGFAPALASDPETRELRVMAELALARAQLASGDRYAASATVDATLETLGDIPLDTAALGPSLGALVEERQRLLDARGQARLRVTCAQPCRVLVDERNIGEVEHPGSARELAVPLGHHRVWVEPLDDATLDSWRGSLELDTAETTTELHYPRAAAGNEAPAPRLTTDDARDRPPTLARGDRQRRVAPRWAEITTLSVGVAALAAGAIMWGLDSRCPGGADPNDPLACPQLYDTKAAGIALVSTGFVATLTGGVMLVVDETRVGDRRGRELALVWTTRF